jgi:hypothetical protein
MCYRIKWHSVVFSFKFSSKESKGGRDPLVAKRNLLEPLDIKAIGRFNPDATTHVVSNKRNTPQTLRALLHGKWIVDETYFKELEYATTEGNLNEPESLSPLETDFDAAWPSELQYLPATSTKELKPRSDKMFEPDPSRSSVFEGYTFVFFDLKQFENLQPVVTDAGGKALHYELIPLESTAADVARYVKQAAGDKGNRELEDGSSGKGVIQIRFLAEPEHDEWAKDIQKESMAITGQALVEQNELLDAILTKDPASLRRSIPISESLDPPAPTNVSSKFDYI